MTCKADMMKARSWFVYVAAEFGWNGTVTGFYKIGSAMNANSRVASLNTGNPRSLKVVWRKDYGSRERAMGIEKMAHRIAPGLINRTEWFECDIKELIDSIALCERLFEDGNRHIDFLHPEDRV